MLHSEIIAQTAFRNGEIEIVGKETFLNRETTLVKVVYTTSKKGDMEQFWIDDLTGIILKNELYENGKIIITAYFDTIDFSPINQDRFKAL